MRHPKPWYRNAADAWYVQLNRRKVLLARGKDNKAEAMRAYHRLMAAEGHLKPDDSLVAELCVRFIDRSRREHRPATTEWYRAHLQSFIDHDGERFGQMRAADLKPSHVTAWLKTRNLGQSSTRGAITAVKSMLSWACKQGLIAEHPLRNLERPPMGRRRPLSAREVEAIFAAVKDEEFRDLLTALQLTGARPSEVIAVTAADVRLEEGVWVLEEHKTSGKTGRPRVIYLNRTMVELTRRQMERHPTGPLFRNTDGVGWTGNAIRCRFRNLRKKLGLGAGAVCYGLRHSFVTDALERDVPIATVAEIVGHSDTKMISAVYSHLHERREHLRRAVEQATGHGG
jgi:integrase